MAYFDPAETAQVNEAFFTAVSGNGSGMVKQAQDMIDDYTRKYMREDGFYRKIIPMTTIGNDKLDKNLYSDRPMRIEELEPNSPAAMSLPYGGLPDGFTMEYRNYPVYFDYVFTPKFMKNVDTLRTTRMDIRKIMNDNAVKDMLAEEDGKFLSSCLRACVGPGLIVPGSGVVQHQVLAGGVTKNTIVDTQKIMPSTPFSISAHMGLMNDLTMREFNKWDVPQTGDNVAADIIEKGWSKERILGMDYLFTIKKGLVPTNRIFYFGDPKFIGKSYCLQEPTMWIKREAMNVEFYSFELIGGAIGNTAAIAIADIQ